MRKWAFLTVAAAIVVIGCAGGGDSGGGTATGTATATTGTPLRVNIPTPPGRDAPYGRLEIGFLTGQGRAIGDLTLVMTRITVQDEFGEVTNPLAPRTNLALGSYSFQIVPVDIPFDGTQNSRLFENYSLDPLEIQIETGGVPGAIDCFGTRNPDGSINRAWPPNPIPIVARVFPGRSTLVPLFIDDSMFTLESVSPVPPGDPCGGTVAVFDEDRFNLINEPPIRGFINDYVSFDISSMPLNQRPTLSAQSGSVPAGRVFLTGDNYAVSPPGLSGVFEVLTQQVSQPIVGNYGPPGTIGGSTHPGTFTLTQLDPTDLFNLRKIVALQGIWKEYTAVLEGFGSWNLVAFPNTNDANVQEVVFFERNSAGVISSFFFGYVDYDLDEMHLFPVKSLVSGLFNPSEEVVASVTTQIDKNGNVTVAPQLTRSGSFNITTRGSLPSGAPNDGTYVVFRV